MRRLLLCAVATGLLLTPLACDLEKTSNQLSAKRVMVATLFSTPDVTFSPAELAGLDGGLPDGGDRVTVPGQTAALAFFGTRENDAGVPAPIGNASLRMESSTDGGTGSDAGTQTVTLPAAGLGTYTLTSDESPALKYRPGVDYRFTAVLENERFVGHVRDAPQVERLEALHPSKGYVEHTAGQPLTLQRASLPLGTERTVGFVTVLPLSTGGEKGEPTYTNLPKDPLEFLQLAAMPTEWRQQTVTLPGTAFPASEQTYMVIFHSARLGGPESDNLFLGSALLVGTADVGVVRTR